MKPAADAYLPDIVDVIVIGAGSAGCVVASRLSENAQCSVLLVESGNEATDPDIRIPQCWPHLQGREFDWAYCTAADPGTNQRHHAWPRGRVLGGSSCLHAMAHVRGHPADFDRWQRAGGSAWSYEALLPYFIRSERFYSDTCVAGEHHGTDGPIPVWLPAEEVHPLVRDFMRAGQQLGVPSRTDHNGPELMGCCPNSLTVDKGQRVSAADAYLSDAVRSRANLHIITGVDVDTIDLQDDHCQDSASTHSRSCVRINCIRSNQPLTLSGERLVVSAGAIGTPLLLMRSGVGDAGTLDSAGITPHVHSPRVGQGLRDHLLGLANVYQSRKSITPSRLQHSESLMYLQHKQLGAMAGPPDIVVGCAVAPIAAPGMSVPPPGEAYSLLFGVTSPESRGCILPTGPDLADAPDIHPNYLATENDRYLMREALRTARLIGEQSALAAWNAEEVLPGNACTSDEALDAFCAQVSSTHHHPCGSCSLSTDADSVVDPDLRVRGLDNVFIVDASVFPAIPSGPIHAAVIAVAEAWSERYKKT